MQKRSLTIIKMLFDPITLASTSYLFVATRVRILLRTTNSRSKKIIRIHPRAGRPRVTGIIQEQRCNCFQRNECDAAFQKKAAYNRACKFWRLSNTAAWLERQSF
jgi:hypothetical protein